MEESVTHGELCVDAMVDRQRMTVSAAASDVGSVPQAAVLRSVEISFLLYTSCRFKGRFLELSDLREIQEVN